MTVMDHWMNGPRLALDFETTGPDPTTAHAVTACLLHLDGGGETIRSYDWLADPGIPIPDEAAEIHGVTTEKARLDGRPEVEVIDEIQARLRELWTPDVPLIIYNASYDMTLGDRRSRALTGEALPIRGPILDALVLDRIVNRYRKGKRRLIMNCGRYGVALSEEDAHSADADCRAAHDLTWAMAAAHPEIRNATLRGLYVTQRRGHRAWAIDFQRFLRNAPRRPDETDEEEMARREVAIDTQWPMQVLPAVAAARHATALPIEEAS